VSPVKITIPVDTSLTFQVLRGCACGAPHPLAQGMRGVDRCPACNAPVPAVAPAVTVPAVLTDRRTRLGMKLITIGRKLSRLGKGT
jgi:hypothetical protein